MNSDQMSNSGNRWSTARKLIQVAKPSFVPFFFYSLIYMQKVRNLTADFASKSQNDP